MSDPGALLDLDGTLVDTNHLHTVAWWRAFRRCGHTVPMQRIFERIGMGGDKLMAALLGGPDDGVKEAWSEEYHQLFDEVTLLPGARSIAERLTGLGFTVVLATSAPPEDLERYREILGIDDCLAGATSSGDADESKPEADIFEVALDRFGLTPAGTIALGDTVWDAEAAAKAGIGFVGVLTGGHHPDELRRRGALAVYEDAQAVVDDLLGSPFGPLATRL